MAIDGDTPLDDALDELNKLGMILGIAFGELSPGFEKPLVATAEKAPPTSLSTCSWLHPAWQT